MAATVSVPGRKQGKKEKREYNKRGEVVKIAARISGRSIKTVYSVLNRTCVSAPVQRAIDAAREELRRRGRAA